MNKKYADMNIKVVGASPDPVSDNKAFAEKIKSPFALLSDTNKALPPAVGSEDKRWAALIDGGRLAKLWEGVDPATGPQEILDDLGKFFAEAKEKVAATEAARSEVLAAVPAAAAKPQENNWVSAPDAGKMDDPWSKAKIATVHDNGGSSR